MLLNAVGRLLGLFTLILGLAFLIGGAYLGIWEMLVGGIVQIIDQCKAPTTDAGTIAWAIVKIIFCELPIAIGFWTGLFLASLGLKTLFHKDRY